MPINETLIDSISQIVSDYNTEPIDKIFFSTIDLEYAYSQLNPNADLLNTAIATLSVVT